MANVIIKTDEQKAREAMILKSYGVNPERATAEQRECAREISRHTAEIKKEMEANRI
ncbi:MAG TPA: hypothetical protein PLP87_05390 [Clostridiales bacterium]|jgi:hypothetical protein|nr:hypothetical protein [Clostridiales bacterium]